MVFSEPSHRIFDREWSWLDRSVHVTTVYLYIIMLSVCSNVQLCSTLSCISAWAACGRLGCELDRLTAIGIILL